MACCSESKKLILFVFREMYKAVETHVHNHGLVVIALDTGSRGSGSSPGQIIVLCFWA